jgi:chromosome segregation ATPase
VVEVQPWTLQSEPEEEETMTNFSLSDSENRDRLADDPSLVATLQRERDTLQGALEKANDNLNEANRKLRMAESERRVWQMSKEEVFRQISLLIENAAKEKEEKIDLARSLKEAESEIGELRGQLRHQETQLSIAGRSVKHVPVLGVIHAEVTDMALILEQLTGELQKKHIAIDGLHRKCPNS